MDEILKDIANLILNGTNEEEKTPAGYHVELVGGGHGYKTWLACDDDEVEREYLVTEGYLWTGQYPEAKRIIEVKVPDGINIDDLTKLLKAQLEQDAEFFEGIQKLMDEAKNN